MMTDILGRGPRWFSSLCITIVAPSFFPCIHGYAALHT